MIKKIMAVVCTACFITSLNAFAAEIKIDYNTNLITLSDTADDAQSATVFVKNEDGKYVYADLIFPAEKDFHTEFMLSPESGDGVYTVILSKSNESASESLSFVYAGSELRDEISLGYTKIFEEEDSEKQKTLLDEWIKKYSAEINADMDAYASIKNKAMLIEFLKDKPHASFAEIIAAFEASVAQTADYEKKNEAVLKIKQSSTEEITAILEANEDVFGISLTEAYYNHSEYVNELLKGKADLSIENFAEYFSEFMAIPYLNEASRSNIEDIIKEQDKYLDIYDSISKYKEDMIIEIYKALVAENFETRDEIEKLIEETVKKENEKKEDKKTSSGGGRKSSGGGISVDSALLPVLPAQSGNVEEITPVTPGGKSENEAFSDIGEYEWARESINALYEMKIINGREKGVFAPGESITRAEFSKIIAGAFKLEEESEAGFGDVESGAWYEKYVKKTYAAGIIRGYENGFFRPDAPVTRQDAAVMLFRALGLSGSDTDLPFDDAGNISGYALSAVASLYENKIMIGNENNCICPLDNLSRAECAKLIYEVINQK